MPRGRCCVTGLTAVSLFAGVGGIDLALERAGIPVVAAVEIDKDCRGVLARHFPETKLFNDVRTVTGDDLRAAGFVPGRGIIAAGFPCQDLSVAGRRAGLGGARSGLFWHIMRLADELSPRWLLLENVPGLLSATCPCPGDDTCTANGRAVRCGRWDKRDGRRVWLDHVPHGPAGGACPGGCMAAHGGAMGTVLGAMGERGFWWAYGSLDAQWFGVPQRRERVFIVGCAGDRAAPVQVLLEPEGGTGHPAARRAARKGAAARAPGRAGDTGTVGTIGGGGPGGGWRVGADEAAAGQLIPLLEVNDRCSDSGGAQTGIGVGDDGDPMFTLQAGKQHGIAATLQGGGKRGHRIDAEGAAGGHLILSQNGSDIQVGDQLGALTSGMARQTSGDLIAFDTVQITSGENRSNPQSGDPSPTLNGNGATCTSPLPFRVGETSAAITAHHGKGPDSDATNGLIMDAPPGSLALPAIAHAITRREGKGADSDATSGIVVTPALAATLTSGRAASAGVNPPGRRHEDDFNLIAHALTSEGADASEDGTGAYGTSGVPRPVPSSLAFANQHRVEVSDQAQPITGSHGQPGCVAAGLAVRRLTPLECERLQGLPDEWTRWRLDGDGKAEQSDSARYRQVGNSVAVPVVEWITHRIAAHHSVAALEAGDAA